MKKKNQTLKLEGHVTQIKGDIHLIETESGCFIWNKEKNSLEEYEKGYADLCEEYEVETGKDLGNFKISDLCGDGVRFIESTHH